MADIDPQRAAGFLIRQHGRNAADVAARLAETKRDAGDRAGCAVWLTVLRTIHELNGDEPV